MMATCCGCSTFRCPTCSAHNPGTLYIPWSSTPARGCRAVESYGGYAKPDTMPPDTTEQQLRGEFQTPAVGLPE